MAAQATAVSGSIASIAAVSEQQSAAIEEVFAGTEEMRAQVGR
jgi:methyl-accepting chemotaxis protein